MAINLSIHSDDSQTYSKYVSQVRRILQPYSLQKNKWLGNRSNETTRLRLYCFTYGHLSSPIVFKNWIRQFPDHSIEIVPVELPGHGARVAERPIENAYEMAETLASILKDELDHPYALFGHSSGALVAYALALHLQKIGLPMPQQLIVSAFTVPTIHPNPVISSAEREYKSAGIEALPTLNDVLEPGNSALVSKIIGLYHKKTQAIGLSEFSPDLIAGQLHAIVSIMRVVNSFDPESIVPLSVPISAFHGEDDVQVTLQDMQSWESLTKEAFSLSVYSGDHLFISPAQSEKLVLEGIREILH